MAKYHEIRKQKQEKTSALIEECQMFFAFSDEQFEKNKTPLKEGEIYTRLPYGTFMPESKVDLYKEKSEENSKWYDDQIKENNLQEVEIEFELANHEAYYTYEIQDTVDALCGRYTAEEVLAVFNKNKHLHYDD